MEYREQQLVRQRGLILCTVKCVDDTLSWERDTLIREVLEESEHELDVIEIIKEIPDGDTDPDEI